MLWSSMRGTVTRWGAHGYGFIRPDDLDVDAWAHHRFLAEPGWVPKAGDRVEFQLKRLSDGRFQAWSVRPAPHTLPPPPTDLPDGAAASSEDGRRPSEQEPVVLGTLGEALLRAGLARNEAGAATSPPSAPCEVSGSAVEEPMQPAQTPAVVATLRDRLAIVLAGAQRTSAALRSRLESLRRRIAELEAEAQQTALQIEEHETRVLQEQTDLITAAVTQAVDELERLLMERRRAVEALRPLREACVSRAGQALVEEYEAIRRRLGTRTEMRDELDRRAYEALERERRPGLSDLAAGLDALASLPVPNARFTLFHGDPNGPCVFVGPLRGRRAGAGGDVDDTADDVRWRVACVFW